MIRPGKRTDERLPPDCKQSPVGLTDVDKLTQIISGCSAVIYCAGSVRGRNPSDFATANITGVKAMLDALGRVPVAPPLLLVSSLAASRPELSDYSQSKHEGEELLRQQPLLPWTILRPPAIYGPGDREMLPVLKMARRGFLFHIGPRNQRFSMLHVDDLADAIGAWLGAWQNCLQKTFAIDDGRPDGYDWDGIGEATAEGKYNILKAPQLLLGLTARLNLIGARVFGYSPMLTPGKVRELVQKDWLCTDNKLFTEATGWQADIDLKQGVQQLFQVKVP
jgi:nucleoside-diphosphate-sugar epimerase